MLNMLNEIIAVPATRTIRGLEREVVVTEEDGMPTERALNCDRAAPQRERLVVHGRPSGRLFRQVHHPRELWPERALAERFERRGSGPRRSRRMALLDKFFVPIGDCLDV
jgi:hypothetical protein